MLYLSSHKAHCFKKTFIMRVYVIIYRKREVRKITLWETLIYEIVPLRDTRSMELIDE